MPGKIKIPADFDLVAQFEKLLPPEEFLPRLCLLLIEKEVLLPIKKMPSGAQPYVFSDLIQELTATKKIFTANMFMDVMKRLLEAKLLLACKLKYTEPIQLQFFFSPDWELMPPDENKWFEPCAMELLMKKFETN